MRIRSVHPSYMDTKWLVALRRETLLAKHVLEGKTKWYTMHPQLDRFKWSPNPLWSINAYLIEVRYEAHKRGYHFDKQKIGIITDRVNITVTRWQLRYEYQWLLEKLQKRDPHHYMGIKDQKNIVSHPLFSIIDGDIEYWEKVKEKI